MDGFLRISSKTWEPSTFLTMQSTRSDRMEQSKRTLRSCYRWESLCCPHWHTRRLAIFLELRWWPLFRSVFQTPQSTGKITVAYRFEPRTHFQTSSEELIHDVFNKSAAMTVSSHTGSNTRYYTKERSHTWARDLAYVRAWSYLQAWAMHTHWRICNLAKRIRHATDGCVLALITLWKIDLTYFLTPVFAK